MVEHHGQSSSRMDLATGFSSNATLPLPLPPRRPNLPCSNSNSNMSSSMSTSARPVRSSARPSPLAMTNNPQQPQSHHQQQRKHQQRGRKSAPPSSSSSASSREFNPLTPPSADSIDESANPHAFSFKSLIAAQKSRWKIRRGTLDDAESSKQRRSNARASDDDWDFGCAGLSLEEQVYQTEAAHQREDLVISLAHAPTSSKASSSPQELPHHQSAPRTPPMVEQSLHVSSPAPSLTYSSASHTSEVSQSALSATSQTPTSPATSSSIHSKGAHSPRQVSPREDYTFPPRAQSQFASTASSIGNATQNTFIDPSKTAAHRSKSSLTNSRNTPTQELDSTTPVQYAFPPSDSYIPFQSHASSPRAPTHGSSSNNANPVTSVSARSSASFASVSAFESGLSTSSSSPSARSSGLYTYTGDSGSSSMSDARSASLSTQASITSLSSATSSTSTDLCDDDCFTPLCTESASASAENLDIMSPEQRAEHEEQAAIEALEAYFAMNGKRRRATEPTLPLPRQKDASAMTSGTPVHRSTTHVKQHSVASSIASSSAGTATYPPSVRKTSVHHRIRKMSSHTSITSASNSANGGEYSRLEMSSSDALFAVAQAQAERTMALAQRAQQARLRQSPHFLNAPPPSRKDTSACGSKEEHLDRFSSSASALVTERRPSVPNLHARRSTIQRRNELHDPPALPAVQGSPSRMRSHTVKADVRAVSLTAPTPGARGRASSIAAPRVHASRK